MPTNFTRLNIDWNAEPNAPRERVDECEGYIELSFTVNHSDYSQFRKGQRATLRFYQCTKWRLGPVNDEGWAQGQCRFSKLAPEWGEFYELNGDTKLELCPNDWNVISKEKAHRHFLFYLRDCQFECSANNYDFIPDVIT